MTSGASRVVTEYAVMNGMLPISGPTVAEDAIRGLWERLGSRDGLLLVERTVTYSPWVPANDRSVGSVSS